MSQEIARMLGRHIVHADGRHRDQQENAMANRDASHERAAWRAAPNLRTGRVHAAEDSSSICACITDVLVAAALDVALAADEAIVDAHADSCRRCAAVLAELRQSRLP
jgi:hypothetical protein